MADPTDLDRTFHFIMKTMVARGTAPHYSEIARAFSVPPEAGRQRLLDLMETGIPAWLHPGTDYIASFPPLNSLPTQYRVSVDGEQKWFAQCGFESLAVSWLFPGKTVTIEAPCLDCGQSVFLQVRDGVVERADPPGIVGYVDVPPREWRRNLPYA